MLLVINVFPTLFIFIKDPGKYNFSLKGTIQSQKIQKCLKPNCNTITWRSLRAEPYDISTWDFGNAINMAYILFGIDSERTVRQTESL